MTTEQKFLKDVESHVIEVIRDDGLYRHIRFRRPGTMCMHFDLITWPGYLCYCGDMGTYVFSRLEDMFEFFRTDREYAQRRGYQLGINPGYWSEKLQAVDGNRRNGSAMEFSADKFRRVINEIRVGWIKEAARNNTLNKDHRRELWEEIQNTVLAKLDDDCDEAAQLAARDFYWQADIFKGRYTRGQPYWQFEDLWKYNFQQFTHHFIWCCYALAWGIQKYDASKQMQEAA